jgi:hypothetical protein
MRGSAGSARTTCRRARRRPRRGRAAGHRRGDVDAARLGRAAARAGALAVVMELDDDELTAPTSTTWPRRGRSATAERAELERQRGRIDALGACDGATVTTEPLAEVVRTLHRPPVIVCPNAIDVDWFKGATGPGRSWADHLTIGWAGWRRPDADLAPMAEAWARIAGATPTCASWSPATRRT